MTAPTEVWVTATGWTTGHQLRPGRALTVCGRVLRRPVPAANDARCCGQCRNPATGSTSESRALTRLARAQKANQQ